MKYEHKKCHDRNLTVGEIYYTNTYKIRPCYMYIMTFHAVLTETVLRTGRWGPNIFSWTLVCLWWTSIKVDISTFAHICTSDILTRRYTIPIRIGHRWHTLFKTNISWKDLIKFITIIEDRVQFYVSHKLRMCHKFLDLAWKLLQLNLHLILSKTFIINVPVLWF